MMFNSVGPSKNQCSLLAVVCGEVSGDKFKRCSGGGGGNCPEYPFPDVVSAGRLEVQVLSNPTADEFRQTLLSLWPNFVYLQGQQVKGSDEVGSLVWGDVDLNTPEAFCGLFGSALPSTVYLEIPKGEKLAEALHAKGVPYVIYWKSDFSCYAACHFRHALLSVLQSSCSHIWDAFQLAHASFKLYCVGTNNVPESNGQKGSDDTGPSLLGDSPKIDIGPPEEHLEGEGDSSENFPAIRIYDDGVRMRFLVCGLPSMLDTNLLGALEYGLEALLKIEVRGCKLHNRTSAPPPPLQSGTFNRGVVTMRCDISTCSSTHVSLLISGSAQTCFNDQLLENHIKNEVVEKSDLVQAIPYDSDIKLPCSEPRKSASIACGASVFEVSMKVPTWASQVLRQLAPDVSCRSLVMLGIASIQGLSVASFEKDDADRLLFFCKRQGKEPLPNDFIPPRPPSWLIPPPPCRKRSEPCGEVKSSNGSIPEGENGTNSQKKLNAAAMRPIPCARHHKMPPFPGILEAERYNGDQMKTNTSVVPVKHSTVGPAPSTNRKALSSSYQAHQIISLNPLPLKKHGCNRAPIQVCSEEEFLRDVMQFLVLRGHHRLVPQGGLAEFPDAILNAKRLDLFNLYREVVSRGGFHVGNGINWKGQVFSKMRNHTLTHRMTGVGNTLKRHYETYLLEYELAHDDVDGECCLICRSSEAGDWVNCGVCGEWAHFECDRRPGLGAFKDYAKTDGLEYVCPNCNVTNFKNKSQKTVNGY